jgi:hypothetical protein
MIISLMSAFSHHSGITAATVEKSCVTIAFFCSSEKKEKNYLWVEKGSDDVLQINQGS